MFLNFPLGFAVNLDLIEAEGFDVPHEWPFWGTEAFDNFSYEKLTENFEACTKRSDTGEIEIYGSAGTWGSVNQQSLFENGGDFFDSYEFDETECLLNSPEVVEAVAAYTDWVIKYEVAPDLGAAQAFKEGVWRAQKGVVPVLLALLQLLPIARGHRIQLAHVPSAAAAQLQGAQEPDHGRHGDRQPGIGITPTWPPTSPSPSPPTGISPRNST